MATRPFNDSAPVWWDLKGGRHNTLSRHRGEYGLWYMVGTWGQGRYQNEWSIAIFPDNVRVSGYAGRSASKIMTEALKSHCILEISGRGGRDYGKPSMSKGGYREGGPISYKLEGKEFDPALLRDGDEFVRQVLGYEPTPQGVKEGAARDKARKDREAAEKAAAEEAQHQQWHEEYQAKEKARTEAQGRFEEMFESVEIPEGFKHRITSQGLEVWRDRENGPDWFRYYDKATLTSVEAHQKWFVEAKEKMLREKQEAEVYAARRAQEEAERKVQETKVEAEKATIVKHLEDLDDLLSNL